MWGVGDRFSRDFKAEVLFSKYDVNSDNRPRVAAVDDDELEADEFFEAEEIFSNHDLHDVSRDSDIHTVRIVRDDSNPLEISKCEGLLSSKLKDNSVQNLKTDSAQEISILDDGNVLHMIAREQNLGLIHDDEEIILDRKNVTCKLDDMIVGAQKATSECEGGNTSVAANLRQIITNALNMPTKETKSESADFGKDGSTTNITLSTDEPKNDREIKPSKQYTEDDDTGKQSFHDGSPLFRTPKMFDLIQDVKKNAAPVNEGMISPFVGYLHQDAGCLTDANSLDFIDSGTVGDGTSMLETLSADRLEDSVVNEVFEKVLDDKCIEMGSVFDGNVSMTSNMAEFKLDAENFLNSEVQGMNPLEAHNVKQDKKGNMPIASGDMTRSWETQLLLGESALEDENVNQDVSADFHVINSIRCSQTTHTTSLEFDENNCNVRAFPMDDIVTHTMELLEVPCKISLVGACGKKPQELLPTIAQEEPNCTVEAPSDLVITMQKGEQQKLLGNQAKPEESQTISLKNNSSKYANLLSLPSPSLKLNSLLPLTPKFLQNVESTESPTVLTESTAVLPLPPSLTKTCPSSSAFMHGSPSSSQSSQKHHLNDTCTFPLEAISSHALPDSLSENPSPTSPTASNPSLSLGPPSKSAPSSSSPSSTLYPSPAPSNGGICRAPSPPPPPPPTPSFRKKQSALELLAFYLPPLPPINVKSAPKSLLTRPSTPASPHIVKEGEFHLLTSQPPLSPSLQLEIISKGHAATPPSFEPLVSSNTANLVIAEITTPRSADPLFQALPASLGGLSTAPTLPSPPPPPPPPLPQRHASSPIQPFPHPVGESLPVTPVPPPDFMFPSSSLSSPHSLPSSSSLIISPTSPPFPRQLPCASPPPPPPPPTFGGVRAPTLIPPHEPGRPPLLLSSLNFCGAPPPPPPPTTSRGPPLPPPHLPADSSAPSPVPPPPPPPPPPSLPITIGAQPPLTTNGASPLPSSLPPIPTTRGAPLPTTPFSTISGAPSPPPLPPTTRGPSPSPVPPATSGAPPPPPPPPIINRIPPPSLIGAPPSIPGGVGKAPPPPPPLPGGRGAPPPPPPFPGGSRGASTISPIPGAHGGAPPPPPPPGARGGGALLPQPPSGGSVPQPPLLPRAPGAPPPPPGSGLRGPPALNSMAEGRGHGLACSSSPASAVKKSSLKPLHWVKVSRAMQGSLWAELQKHVDAHSMSEFDVSELETLFSAAVKKPVSSKSEGRGKPAAKSDIVNLIDLRRAYNTEIMLKNIKMPLPDLMNVALALDDSLLDGDQVEILIKFCPTKEEMELLKNYTGKRENLGNCEQFFLELMKFPRVEAKLRVFCFKIQFNAQTADIRKSLYAVDAACEEIRNSNKLKEIMKKILYLGNTLNQGTARGAAVGFRLDSLLKLQETRAANNSMTLMHYLCKKLASRSPHLLDFHEDFVSLEAASKVQLKALAEEQQAVVKGLEKVEIELIASESDGPVSETFRKTLKDFIVVAGAEVRSLTALYIAVGKNADNLALYFGEDPARCSFEQVITTLLNFVRMFRRSHEENCKLAEIEKKKSQEETKGNKSFKKKQ